MIKILFGILLITLSIGSYGRSFYFDPDAEPGNTGLRPEAAFNMLDRIKELNLSSGDSLLLKAGALFKGSIELVNISGSDGAPIVVSTYSASGETDYKPARINAAGYLNGVLLINCSNVTVSNLHIRANGIKANLNPPDGEMRCGVLVTTSKAGVYNNIRLSGLIIHDVFYEDPGFARGKDEVRTANGTQRYGWGIRFINQTQGALLKDVVVNDCEVKNVAHTGIKFTAFTNGIQGIEVSDCRVLETGGPGIQMSGVHDGIVKNCLVDYSGSTDDSRKWGRGSGLWTWGSSNIIIEHNEFRNANGPGDSAGCHIDFNCKNVIVQYNFSYRNAGGFIEILGNNFNCAYRYNISVNDGYRVKGENGAFQEGKTFWLSGYQGNKPRSGPFNSYIYNNTIFMDEDIVSKIAVGNTSDGVLIANNIFCIKGKSMAVLGDQYKPEKKDLRSLSRIVFKNNLFLHQENWPVEVLVRDTSPLFGNPVFKNPGGEVLGDYLPGNADLIGKGIDITKLPEDSIGLFNGLKVELDILGNKINGTPGLGAIQLN